MVSEDHDDEEDAERGRRDDDRRYDVSGRDSRPLTA